jgi:hypothetical protein
VPPGYASFPGQNGVGTPWLTADVSDGAVKGVIFIVSKRNWTTNGEDAEDGAYRGTVIVTVVADDD